MSSNMLYIQHIGLIYQDYILRIMILIYTGNAVQSAYIQIIRSDFPNSVGSCHLLRTAGPISQIFYPVFHPPFLTMCPAMGLISLSIFMRLYSPNVFVPSSKFGQKFKVLTIYRHAIRTESQLARYFDSYIY